MRAKGVQDLVLGILLGVGAAGIGIGAVVLVKLAQIAVPLKGLAVLEAFALLALMYGVHLTWRGLARVLGGARVKGAVSDVTDW